MPSPAADLGRGRCRYGFFAEEATAETAPAEETAYGFFDRCSRRASGASSPDGGRRLRLLRDVPAPPSTRRRRRPAKPAAAARKAAGKPAPPRRGADTTIRVGVEKVDQLINLVGELVITQAMLLAVGARRRSGAVRTPARRPRAAGAQFARPAGSGDVDPHDADLRRVLPLPARGARPVAEAGQEGRAEAGRRGHRTRQEPDRAHHRSAHPPGAQQPRPRHRDARSARGQGQARAGHHHPQGLPPERQHRHRGQRRRRRPQPPEDPGQGPGARPAGQRPDDATRKSGSSSSRPASRPPTWSPRSPGAASAWTWSSATSTPWAGASRSNPCSASAPA